MADNTDGLRAANENPSPLASDQTVNSSNSASFAQEKREGESSKESEIRTKGPKVLKSQHRLLEDGSVVVIWPRNPTAVDNRTQVEINFRPLPGGPILRVPALRYRPLDESGPFGVTSWAYRIPPQEVQRATNIARSKMAADQS